MNACALVVCLAAVTGQIEPLEPLEPPALNELAPQDEAAVQPPQPQTPKLEPNFPPGTTLFVNASSLALRSGPNTEAGLIKYIPRDGRVVAIPDVMDPVPLEIGNRSGQWLYVQHDGHKGYVFDAYLLQAPSSLDERLDYLCEPGKRVGPITVHTTYEDLLLIFSESNIGEARIPLGEGKFETGTSIFPGDATKQILVQWEIPKVKPKTVVISGTKWRTADGIGPGVTLSKMVELNEAPVSFAGFGWDYAGFLISWRGGKLEESHKLREDMLVYLAAKQPYLPEDMEALTGDTEFSSDRPEAGRLNLHINSMTVMLSE